MKLGVLSLVLGACALLLAVVHHWAGPLSPPPPLEEVVAHKAGSLAGAARDAALAGLRGQPLPEKARAAPRLNADQGVQLAAAVLAVAALVAGAVAMSRPGQRRMALGGAALGAATLLFQLAMLALAVWVASMMGSALSLLGMLVVVLLVLALLALLGG
ncbi:MAG: hypothetical protein Q4G71_08490 [Pseudomonadota bacterium]|nr:hypothetical protein [Pseudomonadota bacterium]